MPISNTPVAPNLAYNPPLAGYNVLSGTVDRPQSIAPVRRAGVVMLDANGSLVDGNGFTLTRTVVPNGIDDTANINAALEAIRASGVAGTLKLTPGGSYFLTSRMVIGSRTTLDLTGASITLKAGNPTNMLTSYANANPAGIGTASVSNGSNVVTTTLGAIAVVGQTLRVTGAGGAGNGTLVGIVRAQTGTTITLQQFDASDAPASATVSGAAASLITRDSDITIIGGSWDRGANGPNSGTGVPESSVAGQSLLLKHIDGLFVNLTRVTSTAGISFVWITDCSDWSASVQNGSVTRTIMQVVGPIYNGNIPLVRGACNDDLLNICGNVYTDQTDTCGNVFGVTVGTIQADGVGGSALKLNAGAGCTVDGISVAHISGPANVGLFMGDDYAYAATTGGNYGTIRIGYLSNQAFGANPKTLYCFTPACKSLVIEDGVLLPFDPIWFQGTNAGAKMDYVRLKFTAIGTVSTFLIRAFQDAAIKVLDLTDWNIDISATSSWVRVYGTAVVNKVLADKSLINFGSSDSVGVRVYETGVVDECLIRDCDFTYANVSGTACPIYASAGTLRKAKFSGGKMKNGAALVRIDAGVTCTEVHIGGCLVDTPDRIANLRNTALDLYLGNDIKCLTPTNAMVSFNNASGVYNVYGGNIISNTATAKVSRATGTEVINIFAPTLPVDLAIVAKTANQMATNTNGALSCGVGPAVANGTLWKNTYSGLTY